MAISASFYRNVFLLNQLVTPSDEFKKHFCKGMFDKPNVAGFIHVSHYLLMIYDAERFRKQVEWPVICKKTEAKYRNDIKDYLNIISLENPDMGFPHILATYLHHASGTKFTIIMWKLSQLASKTYIMRHKGDHEIISVPKLGPVTDLSRTYLQQSKANIAPSISSRHKNCLEMEKAANLALEEEKKEMAKIKAELFDEKQSMMRYASAAPVAASIKQHLANIEDSEIIQMWKNSLDQSTCYIQRRHAFLKSLEEMSKRISGIILNLSNDAMALDGAQLEKIDCSLISELPFPPDIDHCLYHLYNEDKLIYRNFVCLFTSVLCQLYQRLKKNDITDLSPCLLQIEASIEDMSSVRNVFTTLLMNMTNSMEETQSILYDKNMECTSIKYILSKDMLSPIKSILLMPSPLIRINTHCADEKNDLHKSLQFTPEEVTYRSLFSRHTQHNRNHTPDLRTNLFIPRINVDDRMLLSDRERPGLSTRITTPGVNQSCKKPTGKYSRLLAHIKKNVKANCSIMSLPSDGQANSTIMNTIRTSSLLDLNLDNAAKAFFNSSQHSITPVKCTPIKRDTPAKRDAPEETRDVEKEFNCEFKMNNSDVNILTEVPFVGDENKDSIKHENTSRRLSISDLVERYKNLLELSKRTTIKFERECIEHNVE